MRIFLPAVQAARSFFPEFIGTGRRFVISCLALILLGFNADAALAAVGDPCPDETPPSQQVTGSLSGTSVWGRNTSGYRSNSDLGKAAVHAGLLAPGVTGFITVTPLDVLGSFTGSTANGVTTNSYASPYCGIRLSGGVTRAAQTITSFNSIEPRFIGAAPFSVSAVATSGLPVAFSSTSPYYCTVSGNTVTMLRVGMCTIAANQVGDTTWAAAPQVSQTFAINPLTQTITFGALQDRDLGPTPFTVSATASSNLPVSFSSLTDSVCTVSGSSVTMVAAGTCTIAASQVGDATYTYAPQVNRSFTVRPPKSGQTITFNSISDKTLGSPAFAISATSTSSLPVSFASQSASVCSVSGNTVSLVAAGTCSIVATQGGNTSYYPASPVVRAFSVTSSGLTGQTITFPAIADKTLSTGSFTVAPTSSSTLQVTLASTTTTVCTVSGFTITLRAAGPCSIVASQGGNSIYSAATSVAQTFQVTSTALIAQTISFDAITDKSLGVGSFTASAVASSGLPVAFSSKSPATCTVSGTTVSLVSAGLCTIAANQTGNATYSAATEVTRAFQISLNARTAQTINFPGISSKNRYLASFGIGASSTSGLTVEFTSLTPTTCTVSVKTVTIKAVGACMIAANQPGNATYAPATEVMQAFPITDSIVSSSCISETPKSGIYTGVTQGLLWGNNAHAYTTDSAVGKAAVHAGLLAPGKSGYILVTPGDVQPEFFGTSANGITSDDYAGDWCGMVLSLVAPPSAPPVITISRSPSNLMVVGQSSVVSWTTANATSLNRTCVSTGSGHAENTNLLLNSVASVTPLAAWVGYPSTCTWTATGPGGTTTRTEVLATVARTPSGNDAQFVSQSVPTGLMAGRQYSMAVTMINTGSTTWSGPAYRLGSQNPENNWTWGRNRVNVPAQIIPGQTATFDVAVTAPGTPSSYNFQWRMLQEDVQWFGPLTPNLSLTVGASTGPVSMLKATPTNVQMTQVQSATVGFTGSGTQLGGTVTKLELFRRIGAEQYGTSPIETVTGTAATLSLNSLHNLSANVYWFKLRSTNSAGDWTDSPEVVVNVSYSTLRGMTSGVRFDALNKPKLVGWVCQPAANQALSYTVYLDAPTAATGGVALTTGVANLTTELDNASVQQTCGTPGYGHHFNVDLSSYTAQYAGRALFVAARGTTASTTLTLPCADNNCVMPGSMRIALSSPQNNNQYGAGGSVSMQAVVANAATASGTIKVAFSFDGGPWIDGARDTGADTYFLNQAALVTRAAPYTVQARLTDDKLVLYSPINLMYVVAGTPVTIALGAPLNGATAPPGTPLAMSATVGGTGVTKVKFYKDDGFLGDGALSGSNWTFVWASPIAGGPYQITAKALNAFDAVLSTSTAASVTIAAGGGTSSSTPIPVDITPPHLDNADAGSMPGTLQVTQAGSASYAIPIVVPPGAAGLQPALAFEYDSAGGNGMLGLGWKLGGMSSIQRCSKTVAQDGVSDRITFTTSDRLCLDGIRLVRIDGANPGSSTAAQDAAYWAANAVFRTEVESFSRITRLASGFKVEGKDGKIRFYGLEGSSSAQAQGRTDAQPMQWMLARVEDRRGNYMTWEYNNDTATGEVTPQRVRYGGNSVASQDRDLVVRFNYETRTDIQSSFVGGSRDDTVTRLNSVSTHIGTDINGNGGTTVRSYAISYKYSGASGRSLVASIQASATNPNTNTVESLPATTFLWADSATGAQQVKGAAFAAPDFGSPDANYREPVVMQASLDGTGRTSIVSAQFAACGKAGEGACVGQEVGSRATGTLRIRTPEGTVVDTQVDFAPLRNAADLALRFGTAMVAPTGLEFGDINGDGRDDILVIDESASTTSGEKPKWGACINDGAAGGPLHFSCIPGSTFRPVMVELRSDKKMHLLSKFDAQGNGTDCTYVSQAAGFACAPLKLTSATALPTALNPLNIYNFFRPRSIRLGRQGPTDLYSVWTAEVPAADASNPYREMWYWNYATQTSEWKKIDLIQGVTVCFNRPVGLECEELARVRSVGKTMTIIRATDALGDLNGDGLTDFIYTVAKAKEYSAGGFGKSLEYNDYSNGINGPSTMVVCLSKEIGVACKNETKTFQPNADFSDPMATARAGDFIGDGITRVMFDVVPNSPTAAGAKSELCRYTSTGFVCNDMPYVAKSSDVLQMAELDDSGIPTQFVEAPAKINGMKAWIPVSIGAPAGQDRLARVTNGVGNVAEAYYARGDDDAVYSRFATIDSAQVRPIYPKMQAATGALVKQMRRDNGKGGAVSTSYKYEGLTFDISGRVPLGFGRFLVTDDANRITQASTLGRIFPYSGEVLRAITTAYGTANGDIVLSDVVNTPKAENKEFAFASGAKTVFPVIETVKQTQNELNGTEIKRVARAYAYDDWGNVTLQSESVTGGNQTFSSQTVTGYKNEPTSWLLGLPESITTTNTDPQTGAISRKVDYEYDSFGSVKREVVEAGTALQVEIIHDRSNNRSGMAGKSTQGWTDPETGLYVSRSVKDVDFDLKGRFALKTRNALGHVTLLEHYPGTGVMRSMTDPNDLKSIWKADGFGRVQSQTVTAYSGGVPLDVGRETRSYTKQCGAACPFDNVAVVSISEQFSGSARIATPTVTYIDKAGNVLRTVQWGFDGKIIVKDSRYDDQGRLSEVDNPRFADATTSHLLIKNHYDQLSRVKEVEARNDAGMTIRTKYTFAGLITTVTNASDKSETDTHNALGRLISKLDRKGGTTAMGYDAFGNLLWIRDPNNNRIAIKYDRLGRKIESDDPDLGLTKYDLDPIGRIWKQTSAKQALANLSAVTKQFTRFKYDALDRTTARIETDLESRWAYDAGNKAVGKLSEAFTMAGTNKDYRRVMAYDSKGRVASVTQTIQGDTYVATPEYDAWDRAIRQSYQRGAGIKKSFELRYNSKGHLSRVERGSLVLWEGIAQDAAGRPTESKLGNGLVQKESYKPYTGMLGNQDLRTAGGVVRLNLDYQYDSLRSLSQRVALWDTGNVTETFTETFTYDDLRRLESSTVANQAPKTFLYDPAGNIIRKSDTSPGDYVYPPQGPGMKLPHAVKSIPGVGDFTYDENGNLKSGNGRSLTWTSFDMPLRITNAAGWSNFVYGPEHQRVWQERSDGVKTVYAGAQEIEINGSSTTVRTYWPLGAGMEIDRSNGSLDSYWTHTDNLGSVTAISDSRGAIVERLAYDAWGKRRTPDGSATPNPLEVRVDNKGYTGHEMLDRLSLVHMNGRVFDPAVARFMSPDPVISDPNDGQNHNRYSYVLNDPLGYTDPTGFEHDPLKTVTISEHRRDPGTQSIAQLGGRFYVTMGERGESTGRGNAVPFKDLKTPGRRTFKESIATSYAVNGEPVIRHQGVWSGEDEEQRIYGTPGQIMGQWFALDIPTQIGRDLGASERQLFWIGIASMIGNPKTLFSKAAGKAGPVHHICTDKNCISDLTGGPWTPRFEAIFEKGGMTLNDALNKIAVPGHKGPHPEAYHQAVFDRITSATNGLSGPAYRNALQAELRALATEIRTPGSILNKLVTKQ